MWLAATRKARGLTQDALAAAAGINVSQVRRYEGGTSRPPDIPKRSFCGGEG